MPPNSPAQKREIVVIVHGLGCNRLVMRLLERRLQARGYSTLNWRYWSLRGPIHAHAEQLARQVEKLDGDPQFDMIHFVAHSLGSILTRIVLAEFRPAKLGRVVLLTPPNRGSPVATLLKPYVSRIAPVIPQLSDQADSYVNTLPQALGEVQIGVLAACTDVLVPLENTRLEASCDHRTVKCRHLSILFCRETVELVDHFLREGTFGKQ